MARWPNLFIVGAPKAGTTSLFNYLAEHPDVFMPPEKQPSFFGHHVDRAEAGIGPDRAEREQTYLDHFSEAGDETYLGEASPFYLWHPDVPGRIAEVSPDARILISLRDPVQRAYSHYLMEYREGREDESFLDALEADRAREVEDRQSDRMYIEAGRYSEQVKRYFDTFGEDQVLVFLLEELKENPRDLLYRIARFLGIDPEPMERVDLDRHYAYRAPRGELARKLRNDDRLQRFARWILPERLREFAGDRLLLADREKPPMDPEARAMLAEIYEPEIECLEDVLGRDLPELRASWSDPSIQTPDPDT